MLNYKYQGKRAGRRWRLLRWMSAALALLLVLSTLGFGYGRSLAPGRSGLAAYASGVYRDDPVAYWQLADPSGNASAGLYAAAALGKPVFDAAGPFSAPAGGAVALRGGTTGDALQSPASPSLDIRQGSLEIWFRADEVRTNQKLLTLEQGIGGASKFIIGVIAGHLYTEVTTSSGRTFPSIVGKLLADQWYYVVTSYDPEARRLSSYLNGQLVGVLQTDGALLASDGAASVTIGGWSGVGFWFGGRVSEAAVYSQVLTSAQIHSHLLAAQGTGGSAPPPVGVGDGGYVFGTLQSDPAHAAQEYRAGLRVVELVVGWDRYEPWDGTFSDPATAGSYARQCQAALREFLAVGMKVVLDLGLQYPPAWLYTYPNSHYVNQDGIQAPGAPNLTFNQALRSKAEAYIARVSRDLGLSNMWAIRVGAGPESEVLFPEETAGGSTNAYWAFDANAQGRGGLLPAAIPANPYPGWKPGQRSFQGNPFTADQVERWLAWYLDALMDGVNWQISYLRQLGYNGSIHVPMPGWGLRPPEYATAIANYLDGAGDGLHALGRGAVWAQDIPRIAERDHVVIDISSVGDASSVGRYAAQSLCRPSDGAVSPDDVRVLQWSSTRWIAYNARHAGLAVIGETPDLGSATPDNPYGLPLLQQAARLMQSCGLQGLLWAFDANLYDRTGALTLGGYASVTAEYSR